MAADLSVAIVHYHLRPGGVTRVIEAALDALDSRGAGLRAVLLSGEPPVGGGCLDARVRVVEGLGYAEEGTPVTGGRLAGSLRSAARAALGSDPDIWHVHNHSLGKTPALPAAVGVLAGEGERLLLQTHDFAEDARPALYRRLLSILAQGEGPPGRWLYPQAPRVHYATINGRDRAALVESGVPAERLHLLPNPVGAGSPEEGPGAPPPSRGGPPLLLYPTRAIRRKNLGELLLWAAVGRGRHRLATTLEPRNPRERPRYERWVRFAEERDLPVQFGLGEEPGVTFPELVRRADCLVTTSVAEGFGMAFLEPWPLGRPLAGRNLPAITRDFSEVGVDLGALYPRLDVPLEWLDAERLQGRIASELARAMASYGREPGTRDVDRAWSGAVRDDRVDFGRLDEPLQEAVIERVLSDPAAGEALAPATLVGVETPDAVVRANADRVRSAFRSDAYGARLEAIYRGLAREPRASVEPLDVEAVLDRFLDPERFCLLRT